ncbi:TPA: two-component system response regulator [Candidatus Sumerlaeota bacterium]|jgi:CheY-like chemotaxis protein|nr:two-component system response regulator [Candidatus Sumerlaeota bacterium]
MARILVIDDSDNIRQTLLLTLQFKGHEVMEACDGREGLEAIQNGKYDLVFCDLAMPGLNGHEVIRQIRQDPVFATLPILVLSAEAREIKGKAMIAGATDFIDKPFTPQEIFAALDRWLKV